MRPDWFDGRQGDAAFVLENYYERDTVRQKQCPPVSKELYECMDNGDGREYCCGIWRRSHIDQTKKS